MEIIKEIIPANQTKQRPGHSMDPTYITVHNTANPDKGADAQMHARYLLNGAGGRYVSWHFTVDGHVIYQHLPLNEVGWHAGGGSNGTGNRKSIGIEICENEDGNFDKAVENAQWLINKLMNEQDINLDNVVSHKHWSGKYCPHLLLSTWDEFVTGIHGKKVEPAPDTKVESVQIENVSTSNKGKRVESIYKGDEGLNFYNKPSWDNPIATFGYGMGWTIRKKLKVDGAYMFEVENSSGDVYYITAADKYVKVEASTPWYVGKRLEAKVDVNYYDSQRWSNPSGVCKSGYGFTVISKVKTDGYNQYKVKNSGGDVYYISANDQYVRVE